MNENYTINWENIKPELFGQFDLDERYVIAKIKRDHSQRNFDASYQIERALLDYVGEKDFVHHTYKVRYLNGYIYVKFTWNEVAIGASIQNT